MSPEHLQLPVTRAMPYGNYQRRLIADLRGDYLNWFARKGLSDLLRPLRKRG